MMKWRGFGRKQTWANEGSYKINVWNIAASDSLRDHTHILLTSSTTTILLLILQTWNLHRQCEWQAQFWKLLAVNYVIRISPAVIDNPVCTFFLELRIYSFHNYTNGSMLISKQATGCVRSNFVMTSGCRMPIIPITWPLATTSEQCCGKYAGSAIKKLRLIIKHAIKAGNRGQYNTLSGMWYESILGHGGYYFDSISFDQAQ